MASGGVISSTGVAFLQLPCNVTDGEKRKDRGVLLAQAAEKRGTGEGKMLVSDRAGFITIC